MFGLYVPPPVKLVLVCNLLNVHWLLSGNDRLCHVYYTHMHLLIYSICRIIVSVE